MSLPFNGGGHRGAPQGSKSGGERGGGGIRVLGGEGGIMELG